MFSLTDSVLYAERLQKKKGRKTIPISYAYFPLDPFMAKCRADMIAIA